MSKTVIATVNLANPDGGIGLPAGVPVEVDPKNETIKSFIDAGYLRPVTLDSGAEVPAYDPSDPAQQPIATGNELTESGGAASPISVEAAAHEAAARDDAPRGRARK